MPELVAPCSRRCCSSGIGRATADRSVAKAAFRDKFESLFLAPQ